MKRIKSIAIPVLLGIIFVMMVIWGQDMSASAYAGIDLCLRTVIPSLFPFFVLCTFLNSALMQCELRFIHILGRFCRIPCGAESLMIMGLLGGYPIGAQCITQSYMNGRISKGQAERMLGFCNNAGPAFIFGMLSSQFHSLSALWLLWVIQIISSILIGHFLACETEPNRTTHLYHEQISLPKALERSTIAIATVCGWVTLFKIISTMLFSKFNHPNSWIMMLTGILELANGCTSLITIDSIGLRFIFTSLLLSFGGICVHMQTISVTQGLNKQTYFKGKILQTFLSVVLATIAQLITFPSKYRYYPNVWSICFYFVTLLLITFIFFRKSSRFSAPSVIQ